MYDELRAILLVPPIDTHFHLRASSYRAFFFFAEFLERQATTAAATPLFNMMVMMMRDISRPVAIQFYCRASLNDYFYTLLLSQQKEGLPKRPS